MILEVVKNESKNKDDSLHKCLEELNVNSSEVYYYTVEETTGLFGKKKYISYVTTKYAVKDFVRSFLNDLAKEMGTPAIRKSAEAVLESVINVSKDVLKRLENKDTER